MKVIKWVKPDELKKLEKINYCGIGTGYGNIYTEAEYNNFYEDAIIKELVDNKYIICGDTHQYMCIPIFEDNTYIMLSMRKWGEVMAKAANLMYGHEKYYDYKDFYLVSICQEKEKLPEIEVENNEK